MNDTVRALFSILLSYATLILANGMFNTLLGVRTGLEGLSTEVIGVIMGGYFVGLLLGGLVASRVIASVGHIRAFAAFASIFSAVALLHPIWVSPPVWFGFRLASGFCMAGMIMVTESWVNERASSGNRGQVLSIYLTINYAAAGCGPFLVTLGDPGEYQLFSLASILISLALVPVLLTRSRAPVPSAGGGMAPWSLFRVAPLGTVGVFMAGLIAATFHGLGPVFASGIGLGTGGVSMFMATTLFAGLALQWPLGRLSDRRGRGLAIGIAALATLLFAAGVVAAVLWWRPGLLFAAAGYGAVAFTLYSLSATLINDRADPEQRVQVAGGMVVLYGIGASIGPMAAGVLMSRVGPLGLYYFTGGASLLMLLYALWRGRLGMLPRRTAFVAMPSSQYSSEELYLAVQANAGRPEGEAPEAPEPDSAPPERAVE